MKILELFSGYGTASFALKQLGIPYDCVGYSDIDKYANQCFKQNHSNYIGADLMLVRQCGIPELGDCTKINPHDLQDFDLLTGGFPCQAFSVAGKGLGELDTRGTLFNEIIRIAEVKKPRYMLLENVKGLLSKRHRPTFEKILKELTRIGYWVKWKVLNTKDYGIPQNRERVFFMCFRNKSEWENFKLPRKEELKIFLKDILEDKVDDKYYLSEEQVNTLIKNIDNNNRFGSCNTLNNIDGSAFCLSASMGMGGGYVPKISKTIRAGGRGSLDIKHTWDVVKIGNVHPSGKGMNGNVYAGNIAPTIRKLTPKECFRLQGFLKDEINLDGLSNTQRYKLAGNGQSLNVVTKIFKEMFG